MAPAPIPADFDWVTARHLCSAQAFFERLRTGAKQNVATRQALHDALGDSGSVEFESTAPDEFTVRRFLGKSGAVRSISFERTSHGVSVSGHGMHVELTGSLTLTDEGQCRLLVEGEPLAEWQVLKRGLDALFFAI